MGVSPAETLIRKLRELLDSFLLFPDKFIPNPTDHRWSRPEDLYKEKATPRCSRDLARFGLTVALSEPPSPQRSGADLSAEIARRTPGRL